MKKLKFYQIILMMLLLLKVSDLSAQLYPNPPGIEWRRSDYLTHTPSNALGSPVNASLTREEGSNDWWYDVKNSKDLSGNPDGYIVCGYSNPFNWQLHEGNLGCYDMSNTATVGCVTFWPTIPAITPPRRAYAAISTTQTITKYDLFGRQLWMRTYNEGTFNRIIQTSDGNYLAVGGSKSTRDIDGITPIPYNPDGVVSTTINCNSGPDIKRHISAVKIDQDGNVIFNNLYGAVTLVSSLFASANAEGMDVVEFNIGGPNSLYRIIGHHSNGSSAYEQSVIVDIEDAAGLISAGPQNFASSKSLTFLAIDVKDSYPNERFAISGEFETSTSDEAYLAYFSNSTITTTPTTATYGIAPAESYDVCFNTGGEILLPIIESISGYFAEGRVYKINPATFSNTWVNITPHTGSPNNLCAFDLWLTVTSTTDGGFAVSSSKRQLDYTSEWGTPSFVCALPSPIPDYWNSSAYIAKFNSSNTLEWSKIIDVDDAAPSSLDARKKECMFAIAQTPEGGYIMAGNNSYNADETILLKSTMIVRRKLNGKQ